MPRAKTDRLYYCGIGSQILPGRCRDSRRHGGRLESECRTTGGRALWLGKLPGGQSLEQGRPAGHAFPHRHLAGRDPEVRITIRLDHAYAVQVSDGRPFQARRFTEEPVPAFVKRREPRKVFPRCRSRHRNTAVSHSRLWSAIWPMPIRPTFRSRGQPKSFRTGLDRGPRLWPIAAIS